MKHSFVGDSFEMKEKTFLFNSMLIYFLCLINKSFCPVREFVFCFFSADLKVKTDRAKLLALMLSPCVKGSQVKKSPTCLILKPPLFTYIVLKKNFYSLNIEPF